MRVPPELRCLGHGQPLAASPGPELETSARLACAGGCVVPVEGGIPRFVGARSYAEAFGLQWTAFRREVPELDREKPMDGSTRGTVAAGKP